MTHTLITSFTIAYSQIRAESVSWEADNCVQVDVCVRDCFCFLHVRLTLRSSWNSCWYIHGGRTLDPMSVPSIKKITKRHFLCTFWKMTRTFSFQPILNNLVIHCTAWLLWAILNHKSHTWSGIISWGADPLVWVHYCMLKFPSSVEKSSINPWWQLLQIYLLYITAWLQIAQ